MGIGGLKIRTRFNFAYNYCWINLVALNFYYLYHGSHSIVTIILKTDFRRLSLNVTNFHILTGSGMTSIPPINASAPFAFF